MNLTLEDIERMIEEANHRKGQMAAEINAMIGEIRVLEKLCDHLRSEPEELKNKEP